AGHIGPDRRHHHDLPAGLAIADQSRLALRVRMTAADLLNKARLGAAHVLDRLAWAGFGQEADEVARVTLPQGDADLAFVLHSTDAGAVAGAGIEDDERALGRIGGHTCGRQDVRKQIVDWSV